MWPKLLQYFANQKICAPGIPEFDNAFLDCIQKTCRAEAASIWKVDHRSRLQLVVSTDIKAKADIDKVKTVDLTKGKGVSGQAVLNRQTIALASGEDSAVHDNRVDKVLGLRTRSMISSPIMWGARNVYGVLNVINVGDVIQIEDMREMVEVAARLYAQALVKANLYDAQSYEDVAQRYPYLKYSPDGPFARIVELCEKYAPYDDTVLLLGDTGTGKELLAKLIHEASGRTGPLLVVNCGASRPERIADELFGHVKGSFTDADKDTEGFLGSVGKGTLFLDEIGVIPKECQPALLRVLDTGQYNRIGETETRTFKGRIIAATQPTLIEKVQRGDFMEDLAYRLNRFVAHVKPLRERPEDIGILFEHFLSNAGEKYKKTLPVFTKEVHHRVLSYPWPGNVRQMQNVLSNAVVSFPGGIIDLPKLDELLKRHTWLQAEDSKEEKADDSTLNAASTPFEKRLIAALQNPENRMNVGRVNKAKVAKELGIAWHTLSRHMKRLGLE